MTLIIHLRNKQQEKVVRSFLNSLDIGFYSEAEEDTALVNAIRKARKTPLLNKIGKLIFSGASINIFHRKYHIPMVQK